VHADQVGEQIVERRPGDGPAVVVETDQAVPFARVYKENDTSAFKKKKRVRADRAIDWAVMRPKSRQLLADLAERRPRRSGLQRPGRPRANAGVVARAL